MRLRTCCDDGRGKEGVTLGSTRASVLFLFACFRLAPFSALIGRHPADVTWDKPFVGVDTRDVMLFIGSLANDREEVIDAGEAEFNTLRSTSVLSDLVHRVLLV